MLTAEWFHPRLFGVDFFAALEAWPRKLCSRWSTSVAGYFDPAPMLLTMHRPSPGRNRCLLPASLEGKERFKNPQADIPDRCRSRIAHRDTDKLTGLPLPDRSAWEASNATASVVMIIARLGAWHRGHLRSDSGDTLLDHADIPLTQGDSRRNGTGRAICSPMTRLSILCEIADDVVRFRG